MYISLPMDSSPDFLSKYIDQVIYINLDRRTDRKAHIEEEFRKMGIERYERFTAIDRPGQGIVGCGYSHLAVLKQAKERQLSSVLIFEDDFTFVVSPEEFRENIRQFFESPVHSNYDVCMLAYNLHESEPCPDAPFLRRILYAQTASGYLVHSRYYDQIIQLYEWALPLLESTGHHWIYANDVIWRKLQAKDRWVCFSQRIGRQIDGFSDNANCYMNYNC